MPSGRKFGCTASMSFLYCSTAQRHGHQQSSWKGKSMPLGENVYDVSAASGGLISSTTWRFSVEPTPWPCFCPPSSIGDVSPSSDIYGCLRVPMSVASWLRESRSNGGAQGSAKVLVAENCARRFGCHERLIGGGHCYFSEQIFVERKDQRKCSSCYTLDAEVGCERGTQKPSLLCTYLCNKGATPEGVRILSKFLVIPNCGQSLGSCEFFFHWEVDYFKISVSTIHQIQRFEVKNSKHFLEFSVSPLPRPLPAISRASCFPVFVDVTIKQCRSWINNTIEHLAVTQFSQCSRRSPLQFQVWQPFVVIFYVYHDNCWLDIWMTYKTELLIPENPHFDTKNVHVW